MWTPGTLSLLSWCSQICRPSPGCRTWTTLSKDQVYWVCRTSRSSTPFAEFPFLLSWWSSSVVSLMFFFVCFLIKPVPLYPLSKVDCDKTWGDFFFPLNSFTDMQCNCMMGVFPEISRAWLTIDNDIFMWNYEDGWVFLTGIMIIPDWKF